MLEGRDEELFLVDLSRMAEILIAHYSLEFSNTWIVEFDWLVIVGELRYRRALGHCYKAIRLQHVACEV